MSRILIVDDEDGIRRVLRQLLEYEGHEVRTASSGGEALEVYPEYRPDLTFLDVKMARLDGLEVLVRIRELDPQALIVMISGHGTIETAVEATRRGAYDFLEKPLDTDRILLTVRNALQQRGLAEENARLRLEVESRYEIVGRSHAIRGLLERIEMVGPTEARVLITGENGTGKELVARAIHRISPRVNAPFIEVNCAAIPTELIESELFGHVKGSFTGAFADRTGKFELADGGTLFLDEIGDMSLSAQAKVLRALQSGEITRVGSERPVSVDVRVIAATNKDLERAVAEGEFREDLYFRLNVVPLRSPSLRERRDDIPKLAAAFLREFFEENGMRQKPVDPEVFEQLKHKPWPGNVRELKNVVERMAILSGDRIVAADLPPEGRLGREALEAAGTDHVLEGAYHDGRRLTLREYRDRAERAYIRATLEEHDWNISRAASVLGVERTNLHKRMRALGLSRDDAKG